MEKNAADWSGVRTLYIDRRAVEKIKENHSEKIILESEKSSSDQSGVRSVVQNDVEQWEDPIQEGRQTTAANYTER